VRTRRFISGYSEDRHRRAADLAGKRRSGTHPRRQTARCMNTKEKKFKSRIIPAMRVTRLIRSAGRGEGHAIPPNAANAIPIASPCITTTLQRLMTELRRPIFDL